MPMPSDKNCHLNAIHSSGVGRQVGLFVNPRGQGLVSALISIAIMSISIMIFATMMDNQYRQTRMLSEKLAISDFQQQLIRSFADATVCTKLITQSSPALTFDSTDAVPGSANPPKINMNNTFIPIGATPGAPPLATAGQLVSPISSTLTFAANNPSIQPFQIVNIAGTSDGATGNYTADFQVNFDQTKLVQALKPASVKIKLNTVGGGATQTIVSCGSVVGGSCPAGQVITAISPDGTPFCSLGAIFGGIYQTHLCDATCRSNNPLTGTCSCPAGFNAVQIDDYNVPLGAPCGAQSMYENKGMILYTCYK